MKPAPFLDSTPGRRQTRQDGPSVPRQPDATAWEDAPLVVIHKPACPSCWCDQFSLVRSEANGDGSTTRKAICGRCHKKFKIVVEPLPEIGNE